MDSETLQRREKNFGYALLIIGMLLIIIPALVAFILYLIAGQVPQLVPMPTAQEGEFARGLAIFSNVCVVLFTFILIVWAGSIVSSRGVTMIKDVKLKLVASSLKQAAETTRKVRGESARSSP